MNLQATVPPNKKSSIMNRVCRNCGSSEVQIIKGGCDLHPFFSYRVYGLRTTSKTLSTRLRTSKKLKILDRILFGLLTRVSKYCIETEVSSWNITDAMICKACEFYCIHHPLCEEQLKSMYHDYRSETYQSDWEEFEPGYIKNVGRFIGGTEEASARLSSMNPYLRTVLNEHGIRLDTVHSVLDWGGSDGINLPEVFPYAKRYVHDISNWDAVPGVTRLNCIDGSVSFDYIQIMHVLEHVLNPLEFLDAPLATLNPSGIIYLELPVEFNGTGIIEKALSNERRLKVHEHINLYTLRSLQTLAESKNLRILDIRIESIDFYWCKGPCLRLLATKA
jgi:hypothetical protein